MFCSLSSCSQGRATTICVVFPRGGLQLQLLLLGVITLNRSLATQDVFVGIGRESYRHAAFSKTQRAGTIRGRPSVWHWNQPAQCSRSARLLRPYDCPGMPWYSSWRLRSRLFSASLWSGSVRRAAHSSRTPSVFGAGIEQRASEPASQLPRLRVQATHASLPERCSAKTSTRELPFRAVAHVESWRPDDGGRQSTRTRPAGGGFGDKPGFPHEECQLETLMQTREHQ